MIGHIHQETGHRIRSICKVLSVPRSSYYHASEPTPCQKADAGLGETIMSARANPYHNAWTESFMGTLKNEML